MAKNDLISRPALAMDMCKRCGVPLDDCHKDCKFRKFVIDAPPVDAVEIVRCEKCVYRQAAKEYGDLMCGMLKVPMKSNDFCSYGEKEYGANA